MKNKESNHGGGLNLRIGVYSDSYPDERMILNKIPGAQYVQIKNHRENYSRGLRLIGKTFPTFRQSELYAQGVHFTLDTPCCPDVDVIHTFNRVCLHDRNQWIATFEKTFPEYFSEENRIHYETMKRQLPLILSDNCIAILPMSKWAYNYELWMLSQFADPEEIRRVTEKMRVLFPPQELLIGPEEIKVKFKNVQKIRFLYVGSQVKRKGGAEVLKVFDTLHRTYPDFSLVFIGNLDGSYNGFYLDEEEKKTIRNIIQHAEWLEYHEKVSNNEVLQFARQSHVGLLPSMGDTFGFSVLEMQACGCPVITTDRQALPEINNEHCGWLLDTSRAKLMHGDDFAHYSRCEVDTLSDIIQRQLSQRVLQLIQSKELLYEKALYATERVKTYHSPEQYSCRLKELYGLAI